MTGSLGGGGMGEIFLAHDERLDRSVALKGLSADLAGGPEGLDRFRREARTLATLNHPNIVTIFSVEETEEGPFIAMELVEGEPLADTVPDRGMSARRLLELAIPMVDAVASAHERGVVHRDLKPTNVMVGEDGRIKVLDFGLAKLIDRAVHAGTDAPTSLLTREGAVLGTLPYMSPEQVRGEEASVRSDIFALGAVLFEMATGRQPFSRDSSMEIAHAIVNDPVPSVDTIRPDLPRHLARIIGRCLEKEPRRRYQSAADLRNDLQDLNRELDLEAAGASSRRRTAPRPSGLRWSRGVVVAVAAAVVLLIVSATWLALDRSREAVPAANAEPPSIRSLAVLPFDNLMNDPDQDYFVDGMQEALITELAKLGGLRVISRTSAMRYRGTDKTSPEIARELDVEALVEGSVLRVGDEVRITAQLIRGESDEHLWAESYDRDVADVLGLLTEVARAVSGEIGLAVTSGGEPVVASEPVDPAVLELVLRARHAFGSFSREGLERSLELALQAENLDPDYAPAKAQIAASYLLLGGFGHMPLAEAAPAARAAANEALALDETLSEAHTALGWVEMYFDWSWESAADHFRRALELNPIDAYARHGYGDYLLAMGRAEESAEQLELGRKSDPYAATAVIPAVAHLFLARRYDEAEALGREAIELFPEDGALRSWYAETLWRLGRHGDSIAQRELTLPSDEAASLRRAYEAGGPDATLAWSAHRSVERAEAGEASALMAARALAAAGDPDGAFVWLERAYRERIPSLPIMLSGHPDFDSLRGEAEYGDLLKSMGLGTG